MDQCSNAFRLLLDTPEVRSAISAEFDPSSFGFFSSLSKLARAKVFMELSSIRAFVFKLTDHRCEMKKSNGEIFQFSDIIAHNITSGVKISRAYNKISIVDDKYLVAMLMSEIEIYELDSFKLINGIQVSLGLGNYLSS